MLLSCAKAAVAFSITSNLAHSNAALNFDEDEIRLMLAEVEDLLSMPIHDAPFEMIDTFDPLDRIVSMPVHDAPAEIPGTADVPLQITSGPVNTLGAAAPAAAPDAKGWLPLTISVLRPTTGLVDSDGAGPPVYEPARHNVENLGLVAPMHLPTFTPANLLEMMSLPDGTLFATSIDLHGNGPAPNAFVRGVNLESPQRRPTDEELMAADEELMAVAPQSDESEVITETESWLDANIDLLRDVADKPVPPGALPLHPLLFFGRSGILGGAQGDVFFNSLPLAITKPAEVAVQRSVATELTTEPAALEASSIDGGSSDSNTPDLETMDLDDLAVFLGSISEIDANEEVHTGGMTALYGDVPSVDGSDSWLDALDTNMLSDEIERAVEKNGSPRRQAHTVNGPSLDIDDELLLSESESWLFTNVDDAPVPGSWKRADDDDELMAFAFDPIDDYVDGIRLPMAVASLSSLSSFSQRLEHYLDDEEMLNHVHALSDNEQLLSAPFLVDLNEGQAQDVATPELLVDMAAAFIPSRLEIFSLPDLVAVEVDEGDSLIGVTAPYAGALPPDLTAAFIHFDGMEKFGDDQGATAGTANNDVAGPQNLDGNVAWGTAISFASSFMAVTSCTNSFTKMANDIFPAHLTEAPAFDEDAVLLNMDISAPAFDEDALLNMDILAPAFDDGAVLNMDTVTSLLASSFTSFSSLGPVPPLHFHFAEAAQQLQEAFDII
eukprot:jgi/Chrpa1/10530/Chrysochromulina_OHIO_Genome00005574-RA